MMSMLKHLLPETSTMRLVFHRAKALIAAMKYGFPAKKLIVIGVTGTDGKTTTVGMIAHILSDCGMKTGAISTAFFQSGNNIEWNPTQKTSPSPFMIQKFLRKLVSDGCTHAVIECSSHGLLQGRVNHMYPAVAGITNIGEEHLDYHKTMENYIAAKSILFRMLRGKGTKVLHTGDRSFPLLSSIQSEQSIEWRNDGTEMSAACARCLSLRSIDVKESISKATLLWNHDGMTREYPFTLKVPGRFNLDNALCAIGCVKGLQKAPEMSSIVRSLATFQGIAGRMERIDCGQPFSVFIDFTVTPQSYEATLSTLRSSLGAGARLLVLMGSCGDRMKEKRPVIGAIAARLADVIVVTNEDPYTEDPERIIDDILSGMPEKLPIYREILPEISTNMNKFYVRFSDRLSGLKTILSIANNGDIVLLCGKGSDTTMMTAQGQIPWNEREIVKTMLRDAFADAHAHQHDKELSR